MDTLPLVAPEQVGLSAQRLDRVRKWMNGWVDSGRLAGMTAVVMRKGELAFAETCGKADVERNKPMRPDTIFRIYSMTKPLTSTAIMMLYEEGRFQLDDPITRYLPCFKDMRVFAGGMRGKLETVPAERDITFRDLLTHTSGLMSTGVSGVEQARLAPRGPNDTLANYIPKLAQTPLDFQPGTLWRYSGLYGFDVLARIVEIASGQPYDQFLKQRLFDPLGMTSAVMETDAAGTFVGSSFMYATARDWAHFGLLYLYDGVWAGQRILPKGWVAYSRSPGLRAPDQAYGAHFWLRIPKEYRCGSDGRPLPADAFHAIGYEGQFITIIPSRELVLVRRDNHQLPVFTTDPVTDPDRCRVRPERMKHGGVIGPRAGDLLPKVDRHLQQRIRRTA
jgi:CubicO group peptidase (beta-lactamase class C family)